MSGESSEDFTAPCSPASASIGKGTATDQQAMLKELTQQVSERIEALKNAEGELKEKVFFHLEALKDAELNWKTGVAERLTEVDQIKHELNEAGSALTVQVTQELQKQQKVLFELNFYKWALRFFFAAVLGGTVFGLIKFEPYLKRLVTNEVTHQVGPEKKQLESDRSAFEKRVESKRSEFETKARRDQEENDSFGRALAFANIENFEDALPLMNTCYQDMRSGTWIVSDENEKNDIYAYMCWILAELDQGPGGAWKGKTEWDALLSDKFFQTDILDGNWIKSDEYTNIWLAKCYLKFGTRDEALQKAEGYYTAAERAANVEVARAQKLFELAMIDVANNDLSSAEVKLKRASELDPQNFPALEASDYFATTIKSYKNGSDYLLFQNAAKPDDRNFGKALDRLVQDVEEKGRKSTGRRNSRNTQ